MGIGVPRHFDPGMSETAGYFLNIDPCICQKGGVRVPEVVDADFFDPSHIGKLFVVQLDCGIPQGTDAAAYLICFCKSGNRFPSCLVLGVPRSWGRVLARACLEFLVGYIILCIS